MVPQEAWACLVPLLPLPALTPRARVASVVAPKPEAVVMLVLPVAPPPVVNRPPALHLVLVVVLVLM